jgi:mRNA interferase YafQ
MKRDLNRMVKRGKDPNELELILDLLAKQIPLSAKNRDHALKGDEKDFRECHIEPDWLLKYQIKDNELLLLASETGSHSDLFRK